MMKLLRSQSQTVLALVLAVIAFGFLFYGNAGNLLTFGTARTTNDFGRIDGEDLTSADIYDAVREERNSIILNGGSEELQKPGAAQEVARSAWAQLLLEREADRLHINVSTQDIVNFIQKMPAFQNKDHVFDIATYNDRMKDLQVLLHVTPEAGTDPVATTRGIFENIIHDTLRASAVREALFGSVRSSAQEVSDAYTKLNSPTIVSYVTFDPKTYESQLHITPADIEAQYKNNPTNPAYRTQEKRKVDYVLYTLTPEQQKLPDDQKQSAKDALGQKALDFVLAFQPDPSAAPGTPAPNLDFKTEAQKRNLAPASTDFFSEDQPPAGLPPSSAFNQASFALSKDAPVSRVVELDNGVAVLHLAEIQPSQLRPLDEVKAGIEKEVLAQNARQSANVSAQLLAKIIEEKVSKGATFPAAVTAVNPKLQVVTVPAFVPQSVERDPKLGVIAYQAFQLKDNQVSGPFALTEDGGTIAVLHVDSRATANPAGLADFDKTYRARQDQQLQSLALEDWVNWKSRQSGTRRPPQLEAYGNVE